MVVTVGMYGEFRRLRLEGISQRGIAKRLRISRNTVKKYCDGDAVPWERKAHERAPDVVTEDVMAFIRGCLKEDELQGLRKQHHTSKRIYERLVEGASFRWGDHDTQRSPGAKEQSSGGLHPAGVSGRQRR